MLHKLTNSCSNLLRNNKNQAANQNAAWFIRALYNPQATYFISLEDDKIATSVREIEHHEPAGCKVIWIYRRPNNRSRIRLSEKYFLPVWQIFFQAPRLNVTSPSQERSGYGVCFREENDGNESPLIQPHPPPPPDLLLSPSAVYLAGCRVK